MSDKLTKRQKRAKKVAGKKRYVGQKPAIIGPLNWLTDLEKVVSK